jgi:hypothetical protein
MHAAGEENHFHHARTEQHHRYRKTAATIPHRDIRRGPPNTLPTLQVALTSAKSCTLLQSWQSRRVIVMTVDTRRQRRIRMQTRRRGRPKERPIAGAATSVAGRFASPFKRKKGDETTANAGASQLATPSGGSSAEADNAGL